MAKTKMNLISALQEFKDKNKRTLFTTPGHSQGSVIPNNIKKLLGKDLFKSDLSEIDDFDNIRWPESIFLQSQKKAADIYGAGQSFYLFNGSTSGMTALMLSCLKEGDKVLISRNAHVSVYNGLVQTGAMPVWVQPQFEKEWGVYSSVTAACIEKKLQQNHDIKAVIITSPTYEGITSDIAEISTACKEHGAILIVDEAHGALWNFSEKLPTPAIKQGADASIQSLHKTATALTQGAILHLSKDSSIQPYKVQESLNLINSTSPSYPIIASVEGAVEYLDSNEGKQKLNRLMSNIEQFKTALDGKNIEILDLPNTDPTKLFIRIKGISGYELSKQLMEQFNIEDELCNSAGILAITGIGTDSKKLKKLEKALKGITSEYNSNFDSKHTELNYNIEPITALTPREAFFRPTKKVSKSECIGKISKELVIPYPPGIPILIPGETIQKEHLAHLEHDLEQEFINIIEAI